MSQRTVVDGASDPLSLAFTGSHADSPTFTLNKISSKPKTESLVIRVTDEARIVSAFRDAAKKHTTGAVFNVKVDVSLSGTLGIGVKDLTDNILAVSMLKRTNGLPGAGELAGVRLGDIVFGINFIPTREGSKTLLQVLKRENSKKKKYLHLQCWRCHQLCSDPLPGTLFPRIDEMFVHSYSLYRTKVFIEWERWNFVEILIGFMMEELKSNAMNLKLVKSRVNHDNGSPETSERVSLQSRMNLDLERNILQAKGLRTAICVRIVHTKSQTDAVTYVLRVEDVETGLQWVVHRRYRDFHSLHEELSDMNSLVKDIAFPKKSLALRSSAALIETRIVALEQYIRRVLHILTVYATTDPQASRSLRHVQNFLGVDKYIDCIHPPPVDDQRFIELMAYQFLNDFNSPACQQCVRFVTSVDLDNIMIQFASLDAAPTSGIMMSSASAVSSVDSTTNPFAYRPVLNHMHDALSEVENFVINQHNQQMSQALRERRPDVSNEDIRVFVRKCVRRQVEGALYMPLRRTIFRIVYSFLASKSSELQRSMAILQYAEPSFYGIDSYVTKCSSLPKAIKAFRDVIQAYLPADQCQLLMLAAAAVAELHTECVQYRRQQTLTKRPKSVKIMESDAQYTEEKSAFNIDHPTALMNSSFAATNMTKSLSSLENEQSEIKLDETRHTLSALKPCDVPTNSHSSFDFGKLFKRRSSNLNADSKSPQISQDNSSAPNSLIQILVDTHLTDRMTLADPVKEMFTADETVPSDVVLRHNRGYSYDSVSSANETPSKERESNNFSNGSKDEDVVSKKNDDALKLLLERPASRKISGLDLGSDQHDPVSLLTVAHMQPSSVVDRKIDEIKSPSNGIVDTAAWSDVSPIRSDIPDHNISPDPSITPKGSLSNNECTQGTPITRQTLNMDESVSAVDEDPISREDSDEFVPDNRRREASQESNLTAGFFENSMINHQQAVVSADDFLPLFTYVLVQSSLPHLLLVKEIMTSLVDDEEVMGECGYYLTTLEASAMHITELAKQYEESIANGKVASPRNSLAKRESRESLGTHSSISPSNRGSAIEPSLILSYYDNEGHATIDSAESGPFGVNFSAG